MIDGSISPSDFLLGGFIGLMTIILPLSVVIPTHYTNSKESVKINNIVNTTSQ
jgi:hypothetical protein